jgi:two-component system, LytTR family, response regulator
VAVIRTLIVDDEPMARASIAALLRGDPEIEIIGECGSGTEAIEAIRANRPQLLFIDVQMPGCDGFEVLERLGGDAPGTVVFVTAYDKYALKAFEVGAQDYLLKPFDDARFFRVLARARSQLQRSPAESRVLERIMVRSAGRVTFLRADEIDWIEAADYYASLHVGPRTHLVRRSMSDLERDLDPRTFCRVHRSAIVNVARVRELRLDANGEYEIVLDSGTKVRLSRSYREHLQGKLGVGA